MSAPNESTIAEARCHAPVLAGHRVALDPDEWVVVRDAIQAGDDVYVAAVVRDGGRFPLVRNRWSDGWVLPGGSVEDGESLRDATVREVREETGLDSAVDRAVAAIEQTFAPPSGGPAADDSVTGHLVVHAATARTTTLATAPGVTGDEIDDVRWFSAVPDRVDGVPRPLFERVVAAAR